MVLTASVQLWLWLSLTSFLVASTAALLSQFYYIVCFLINLFIVVVLGLHCCTQAFSSCSEWRLLFSVVFGFLIAVASRCREQAFQHRLSSWAPWAVAAPRHVGSFPDYGLDSHPQHCKADSYHCTIREVLTVLISRSREGKQVQNTQHFLPTNTYSFFHDVKTEYLLGSPLNNSICWTCCIPSIVQSILQRISSVDPIRDACACIKVCPHWIPNASFETIKGRMDRKCNTPRQGNQPSHISQYWRSFLMQDL